jgi:hypothetical protein
MTKPEAAMPGDLLWGVPEIAAYIQRNHRTTYYLIGKGAVPVTKLGPRTIVARKSEIDRALFCGAPDTSKATPREEPKARPPKVPKRRLRRRITAHDTRA